ncbi:MAG TPA: transketolase C-terminal domain-containing protein [Steroidobacteraceae bacterium]|jgi:transketolase
MNNKAFESSPRNMTDAPFGHALVALARRRPEVVALSADLSKYTDVIPFIDVFPKRFFNIGMAEQNLFSMAAGMARTGMVPFCTTYGVFATRRAYDFMAIGCAHAHLNVKIFAGLPGLTTGYGGTHQATEDTGLARLIPDLVVIDPCDATEIAQVVEAVAEYQGPVYVRLLRASVPVVLSPENYKFTIGKATILKEGSEMGFVSTGFMTERALDAAAELAKRGIKAGVLHVPTLKPLDSEAIAKFAASVPRVLVAENHVSRGGLASQVAEVLYDAGIRTRMSRVGLPDKFIECGSVPTLQRRYGLTVDRMIDVALAVA